MAFMDLFVGVPQSKYASIAILIALAVVGVAMLFGKDEVPIGQRFMFVLLMFIIALPSILLSLFQLTCLVTGAGLRNQRWWCAAYAWIGSIFIILYSAVIIVIGVIAMANGTNIDAELNNAMMIEAMQGEANKQAYEYFLAEKEKENESTRPPAQPATPPDSQQEPPAMMPPTTPSATPPAPQQKPPAMMPPTAPQQKPPATMPPPSTEMFTNASVPDASMPKSLDSFASYHEFGSM